MSLLVTDAIVLHAFDYLESSRILRLLTREAGVQSVLAKGARRSAKRFGGGLDLFTEGSAQLHVKPGRELHTLGGFDATRSHGGLGEDLGRFTGATAIAELILRFVREEASSTLFDVVSEVVHGLATARPADAPQVALAGAWRVVAELGFSPALDGCASCHRPLEEGVEVVFGHTSGGALCPACAGTTRSRRPLPDEARSALRRWLAGEPVALASPASARAHQRLLREFLIEHLGDGRPLRAFETWERTTLEGAR